MKRKPALLLCVLFLFLLLLTSCGKSTTEGAYSAVDARGKTVSLSHEPRRILTDSLHLDETLLTVVPKSHLAGAYYLDGEPGLSFIAKETETLTKVREYTPERIAALQPDVFVVSDWSDPLLVKKVEEMGIPVFFCHRPVTVAQIEDNVRLLALLTRQEIVGRKVIARMERELDEIEEVTASQKGRKPVGILLSLMSQYGGAGSLYDELAARGGWVNGLSKGGLKNGMPLSKEAILAARPDFFLASDPYPSEYEDYEHFLQGFFADPFYASLRDSVRMERLADRYVYDASPMAVYGIKKMSNHAYGKILFPDEPEELLKGYEP